jgi:DNA-directed RNA polymerase specialized sigma24 family protein
MLASRLKNPATDMVRFAGWCEYDRGDPIRERERNRARAPAPAAGPAMIPGVATVDAIGVFAEKVIRPLLTGPQADIDRGLVLMDQHLRQPLCGWLQKRFPKMTVDDLSNTWQDILICVLQAVQEGRFDGSRPLMPWLFHIANARATDHSRRASAQVRGLEAIAANLRHTQTGQQWQGLDQLEQQEVLDLIQEAIELLPGKQQVVFQVFFDHFPGSQKMKTLRRLVSRKTGLDPTNASIKRAFQEGQRKVRAHLRRHGYILGHQRGEQ